MPALPQQVDSATSDATPGDEASKLGEADLIDTAKQEVILFFVQLAENVGLPRSLGQIYGFLFCATEPMPFDSIVSSAGVSKGSVSQGLRTLESMKAIQHVIVLGDRRTFYEAETSVRRLFGALLEESVGPSLEGNVDSLGSLANQFDDLDSEEAQLIYKRLQSLRTWHRKAKRLLPWILKLTSPDNE